MPGLSLKLIGQTARIIILAVWLTAILLAIAAYLSDPQRFTASNIALFVLRFQSEIWLVYFAISAFRGLTLLPSTPLILAGTMLYPDRPWLVLSTSLLGILLSSTMIYYFSEALGFAEYFEKRKPNAVAKIRHQMERPSGLAFVALWAFFPLVPTDLVCYVAGTTKTNYAKFILAVLAGEFVLCCIYVFSGGFLFGRLV